MGGPQYHPRKKDGKWLIYHQVENDNPWDLDNTIIKMACKRALVAATLNATAASDIFTQDVEDLPKEMLDGEKDPTPPQNPKPAQSHAAADAEIEKDNLKREGKNTATIQVLSVKKSKDPKTPPFYIVDTYKNQYFFDDEKFAQVGSEAKSIEGDLEVVWFMKGEIRWIESMRIPMPNEKKGGD